MKLVIKSSVSFDFWQDEARKEKETTHGVVSEGVFEPCKVVEANTTATELLATAELGWDVPAPPWVIDLCPEVMEHLHKFPYFKAFPAKNGTSLPVSTTEYTSRSLCTLKALQQLANNLSMPLSLDAGSHLGAARHGQPIPWDDDVDVSMPREHVNEFLNACNGLQIHPTAQLRCHVAYKCLKIYVEYDGMATQTLPRGQFKWKSPFVDLFFTISFQMFCK